MRIILALILFLYVSNTSGQASKNTELFEGWIMFKHSFVNKTNKYDSLLLSRIAGEVSMHFVKDGNSLTNIQNGITTSIWYIKDENKYYRQRFNSDTLFWESCVGMPPDVLEITKTANIVEILGIKCDELKIKYANRTTRYYYNSDTLKIDPEWKNNCNSFNEYYVARVLRSIALSTIIEYEDFSIHLTAVAIANEKLNNDVFNLPNKPILKAD